MRRAPFHLSPSTFHLAGTLLLVIGLCAPPALAQCPAGTWARLAPMREPRQEHGAAELGGKIYVVAGLAGRGNANEIYDPATNTWSLGADLPITTDHSWAVALRGRVYVGGGVGNRVFSHDPGANAWTEVAPSAYFHGGTPAAGVIGDRIYVAAGAGGGMVGNELEAYEPATNRWTILPPMSCARNHVAGAVLGGKLHVAGGRPGNQRCLEVYDPASNVWTRRADMPTGRSGIAGAAIGSCFYVFGGEGNPVDPAGIFHEVEAYQPATDSWTRLPPMQTGRHGIYAAVNGSTVYLPGGATRAGFGVTGINEAYLITAPPPAEVPRDRVVLTPRRGRP